MATSQPVPEILLIQKKNEIANYYQNYIGSNFGHLANWNFCLNGIRICIDNMSDVWTSAGGMQAIKKLESLVADIESDFNTINEYVKLEISTEITWQQIMTRKDF